MQIRLTVLGYRDEGPGADVLVTAPTGTTFGAVAGALRSTSGTDGQRFWVGDVRLADNTPLGRPPLVDGALVTVGGPGPASPAVGSPELRVVGGPDAGGVHLLRQGTVRIGRAPDAEIRIGDPDLSRLHAELTITPGARGHVEVTDLGSTNGTTLDGAPVGPEPARLEPGSLLRLGETTVTAVLPLPYDPAPPDEPEGPRPDGLGHVVMPRRPRRPAAPVEPVRVDLPDEPAARRLGFAGRRRAVAVERAELEDQARLAVLEEVRRRRELAPDPATLLLAALDAGAAERGRPAVPVRVWERSAHPSPPTSRVRERSAPAGERPAPPSSPAPPAGSAPAALHTADRFTVRLGTGDFPSDVTISSSEGVRRLTAFAAPVTVSLRDAVLGLAGPRPQLLGLARSAVAQLAALYGPHDLELVLLCADPAAAADWAWLRWLPHLRPTDGQDCRLLIGLTRDQVLARTGELLDRLDRRGGTARHRRTVVVLDGAGTLTGRPELARVLAEGPAAGIHALCLDDRAEELPLACAVIGRVTGEVGTRLALVGPGATRIEDIVADAVSPAWADRFARAVAPLREAATRAASPLPETVRLLDLLGLDLMTPAKVLAAWRESGRGTRGVLGADVRGAVTVDLDDDGPHAVIGGTAGSGKTEMLAALIASLAVANRPDQLALALVRGTPLDPESPPDGLAGCAELPHTLGYLDEPDTARTTAAAAALLAELDRREHLLGDTAFAAYRAPDTGLPLPRLLVAVDDVDRLARLFPDFVKGLADVVHRGGPVGVHLAVATGTPSHADSIEATAEADLRIALRTDDAAGSHALIHIDDAGTLDDEYPGRALIRGADGAVHPFQTGRVTGRMPRTATLRPTAVRQDWTDLGTPLNRRPPTPPTPTGRPPIGPTDLALLVGTLRRTAEQLGAAPLPRLW
ncbi:FHA domain-containing protein [Yinghuangia seranimata]|uniref:FHA domain-containing protein n=1 Tax=Yinghuangia seranimata TaxID=408067 RepID=UPI00248C2660|nr:FHA domain-containing protein [Yinghuangia seranimata]MDI2131421.1 FHA domain-containing protein [Yinghuangia seranimata]